MYLDARMSVDKDFPPKGSIVNDYNSPIPKNLEASFKEWINQLPENLRGNKDYDLAGAFLSGIVPSENNHLPDTFKKPNHPTFSDQSIYSNEDFKGGTWRGEEFTPSEDQLLKNGVVFYRDFFNHPSQKGSTVNLPDFNLKTLEDRIKNLGEKIR